MLVSEPDIDVINQQIVPLTVIMEQNNQDLLQLQTPASQVPMPSLEDLPSIETIHRTYIPTFTWIPKAARADFS